MAEENENGFLDAFAIMRAIDPAQRDQTPAIEYIRDLLKDYQDPADLVFGVASIARYTINQFAKRAELTDDEVLSQLYEGLADTLADPES